MLSRSQSDAVNETRSSAYLRLHKAAATAIHNRWAKFVALSLFLIPAVALVWHAGNRDLDPNAGASVTRQTGDWSLGFLLLTLAISPLRRICNLPDLARFRRMFGLFAFFYGCLHLMAWRIFKLGVALRIEALNVWSLRIGFVAFVVMLLLAITSTDGWIRRMGGKRWRALHALVYLSAVAGIVHYCLLPDIGIWKPAAFGAMVALLLLLRIRTFVMLG